MIKVVVARAVTVGTTGDQIATLEFSRVPITGEDDYSCSAPSEVPKNLIDEISGRLAAGEICSDRRVVAAGELYWARE